MSYVRPPTDEEWRELTRLTRQEVGRVSQRAQMVLLSAPGRTCPEIARLFGMTDVTVRFWLRRFTAAGPDGLYDEPRSGRPPKVTPEARQHLNTLLHDDPARAGYLATCWTVARLVLALASRLQLPLSLSTVRATLHELGLRWGRPRLAMPQKVDPDKAPQHWLIAQAVLEAGPEAVVLYADESRIQLLPLIRARWHWVGQQSRVPTPGRNDWRALFGALNSRTGPWTYCVRPRRHQEDFVAFLDHLLGVYPTGTLILIVDTYSSHTAGVVRAWLAAHPRVRLFYLPTYCSHLNPVEHIWLRLKNKIAANRLYGSRPVLLQAVADFFDQMAPEQALAWAAA